MEFLKKLLQVILLLGVIFLSGLIPALIMNWNEFSEMLVISISENWIVTIGIPIVTTILILVYFVFKKTK